MIIANRFTVNSTRVQMPERESCLGEKWFRVSNRVLHFGSKRYPVFVQKGGPCLCLLATVHRSPIYRQIKPSGHTDAYFVRVINLIAGIFHDTRGYWQRVVSTAVVSVKRQATRCTIGVMIPACGIDSLLGEKELRRTSFGWTEKFYVNVLSVLCAMLAGL